MLQDKIGAGEASRSNGAPAGAEAAAQWPALHGVRIVDLTQFEAGTSCTQSLAWLGADVIKVEERTSGEQGRRASADRPDADSFYFMYLNSNKCSVTANLKHEGGKEILRSLICASDVFIENFAPGVIERLGFGYEEVAKMNPRIIYAQIKGFPPDGPYASFPSFDMIAQSVGGAVATTGSPEGPRSSLVRPSATRERGCTARSGSWRRSTSATGQVAGSASKSRCRSR
jgi:formyl-CoA transferase